jgi:hypothetical protein
MSETFPGNTPDQKPLRALQLGSALINATTPRERTRTIDLRLVTPRAAIDSTTSAEEFLRVYGVPRNSELIGRFPLLGMSPQEKAMRYVSGRGLRLLHAIYPTTIDFIHISQLEAEQLLSRLLRCYTNANRGGANNPVSHAQNVFLTAKNIWDKEIAEIRGLNRNTVTVTKNQVVGWLHDGIDQQFKYELFEDTIAHVEFNMALDNGFRPAYIDQVYRWDVEDIEKELIDKNDSSYDVWLG